MSDSKYIDPIINAYIELFKEKNTGIKAWYQGDPLRLPASEFPIGMLAKQETRITQVTNAEDEHGIAMYLTVVADVRKELSTQEDDQKIIAGIAQLYDIIEGRDSTTFALKDDSILDILRTNQLVSAQYNLRTDLSTITRVDYGETLRDRDPSMWSIEARVEFVAHFIQNR